MVSLLHTTIMQTTFGLQCIIVWLKLIPTPNPYQHMWLWFELSCEMEVLCVGADIPGMFIRAMCPINGPQHPPHA